MHCSWNPELLRNKRIKAEKDVIEEKTKIIFYSIFLYQCINNIQYIYIQNICLNYISCGCSYRRGSWSYGPHFVALWKLCEQIITFCILKPKIRQHVDPTLESKTGIVGFYRNPCVSEGLMLSVRYPQQRQHQQQSAVYKEYNIIRNMSYFYIECNKNENEMHQHKNGINPADAVALLLHGERLRD